MILALLVGGTVALVWRTSRPVELDPAQLTPAEGRDIFPGLELFLSTQTEGRLRLCIVNDSGTLLESAAGVDGQRELYFVPGLEVLLEGVWYQMPGEAYEIAGIGLIFQPGDSVEGTVDLSRYGELSDGAYRVCLVYQPEFLLWILHPVQC